MKNRMLTLVMLAITIIIFLTGCIQLTNKSITPHLVQKTGLTKTEVTPAAYDLDSLYELLKYYQSIELSNVTNQLTINTLLQKIEKENLINAALFTLILDDFEARNTTLNTMHQKRNLIVTTAWDTINKVLINDVNNLSEARLTMAEIKNY